MDSITIKQLHVILEQGLEQLSLTLCQGARNQLISYLELLLKWNAAYNLTAVRDPEEMVVKHLLDSLAILPWVTGRRVLDVGSGAGLPGIPLAICLPGTNFTLLDSKGKKTRFLAQVRSELALTNLVVEKGRVEAFDRIEFDQILCRAFSSLPDFYHKVRHLMLPETLLLAMKGQDPSSELDQLAQVCRILDRVQLQVPFLAEARHLVIFQALKMVEKI